MRGRSRLRLSLAIAVLSLLGSPSAFAQGTNVELGGAQPDPDAPVEITSETLSVDRQAGTALFETDVLVIQGQLRLTSDEVLVKYFENTETGKTDIEEIIATGNVVMVNGLEAAEGDRAVYTPINSTMVMTGEVLLTQGPSTVAGDTLVVDLETGEGTMEGRVRTVFQSGGAE